MSLAAQSLTGLVVCGGKSSRMGRDKSLLSYHGRPQRYFLADMLRPFCENVFISCNAGQAKEVPAGWQTIPDSASYADIGPMASLLSAFERLPGADFLVIGCDYPFVDASHLRQLVKAFEGSDAVCFRHGEILEPLVAIYSYRMGQKLHDAFKNGKLSLRHFLAEIHCKYIEVPSADFLRSVDDEAGYHHAMDSLARRSSG
jgi:molybdopterin-guanine dinucleotide biosynthesis protein A